MCSRLPPVSRSALGSAWASRTATWRTLGVVGEEIYNFDPADPRFITELVFGPLDGGSPAFGGNLFAQVYANVRTANIMLHAMGNLSDTPPTGMTPAEKEATLAYAQTLIAYDLLRALNTRYDNGIPIDVDIDPTGAPAAIVDSGVAFTHIINLLDSAATHLTNVGDAPFPFQMSAGYAGFDRTLTFLTFNRALRARVSVYRSDYAGALTALSASFINTTLPLNLGLGVYHTFSAAPGDSTNNLFDPQSRALVAYPTLETDAQLQIDGVTKDGRFVAKTILLPTTHTSSGLSSDRALNVYHGPSDPVPIIRNEELILLRAEANIGLGNLAAAVTDINLIRQNPQANLPPYAGPVTQPALLAEVLYNKRYSLLLRGRTPLDRPAALRAARRRAGRQDGPGNHGLRHPTLLHPVPVPDERVSGAQSAAGDGMCPGARLLTPAVSK